MQYHVCGIFLRFGSVVIRCNGKTVMVPLLMQQDGIQFFDE